MTSRSEVDQPLSAAAISYAERGWPVFPLLPRGKTPLTKTGFKVATSALDQVESWWDQWPNANIGIATGEAFDVLDVDGISGTRALQGFWQKRGITYRHEGPVSYTGKGWHALFAPTGHANGAALLGPGSNLDFRGTGGYIVAPPSIHPDGHAYRWDPARDVAKPLPEAPDWLFALLNRDDNPAKAKGPAKKIFRYYEELMRSGEIPADHAPHIVRQRIHRPDILEVCAEKSIALRQRGHYYVGQCPTPEHEDSTPSCAFYTSNDTWYCYGCQAHGDSYDLQRGTHL